MLKKLKKEWSVLYVNMIYICEFIIVFIYFYINFHLFRIDMKYFQYFAAFT